MNIIGCRDCESRCPFEVPIARRMSGAARSLEEQVTIGSGGGK